LFHNGSGERAGARTIFEHRFGFAQFEAFNHSSR
jgi:hypothetical protein